MKVEVFGELRRFAGARGVFQQCGSRETHGLRAPPRAALLVHRQSAAVQCRLGTVASSRTPRPTVFLDGCGATQLRLKLLAALTASYLLRHGQGELERQEYERAVDRTIEACLAARRSPRTAKLEFLPR